MDTYAPSARRWEGRQTAYTAGLSYFPDAVIAPEPMGFAVAAIPAVISVGQSLFGGGSGEDAKRQNRVNYVLAAAQQGNVAAAQLILGAPPNVSSNERPMWINAANSLQSTNPDVLAEAQRMGPAWLTGSNEPIETFPATKAFIQAWGAAHQPLQTAANLLGPTIGGAVQGFSGGGSSGGVSPVLLAGGALALVLLMRKRK